MGNAQPIHGSIPTDYSLSGKVPMQSDIDRYVATVKKIVEDNVEDFETRQQRYIRAFEPDCEVLKKCSAELVREMTLGLQIHKNSPTGTVDPTRCSLKMLDAFVPRTPSGSENGEFYALDFGGSNFRVLRCEMSDGKVHMSAKKTSLMNCKTDLPKGLLDPKATASLMFDFFANVCKEFMIENGDINSKTLIPAGFTFSYPCIMKSIRVAHLVTWTKGFETGRETEDPVEGNDVCVLMNTAFRRAGIPLDVNCVANDTVGTLLSCAYTLEPSAPSCAIGVILGTGVNAAYMDERAVEYGYNGHLINIEVGNYNKSLPRTNIDYEIDFSDVAGRGLQQLEKMVSGAYLGEIVRRAIVKVYQYKATPKMWHVGSFASEDVSTCIGDKSESLIVVAKKCRERWDVEFDFDQLRFVKDMCEVVFRRSAAISAMMIAGIAIKSGKLQEAMGGLTVGIDGSLWKCNPKYRDDLRHYLEQILGKNQAGLIKTVNSDDGSGLGAAILSAVAHSN